MGGIFTPENNGNGIIMLHCACVRQNATIYLSRDVKYYSHLGIKGSPLSLSKVADTTL